MTIGVIGCGMVGGTLVDYLQKQNVHTIRQYDPAKGLSDTMAGCEAVFICVPVRTNEDGSQDLSILEESIGMCPKGAEIYVRSSVLPGTCGGLSIGHDRHITALPEFLTERHAAHDMTHLQLIVGMDRGHDVDYQLHRIFPDKNRHVMTSAEAELTKYTHNGFAALKVNYFNQIYELCDRLGLNYAAVSEGAIRITGFIKREHTRVPGPDGQRGFGGKCLPKDLKAFAQFCGAQTDSLWAAYMDNLQIRPSAAEDAKL